MRCGPRPYLSVCSCESAMAAVWRCVWNKCGDEMRWPWPHRSFPVLPSRHLPAQPTLCCATTTLLSASPTCAQPLSSLLETLGNTKAPDVSTVRRRVSSARLAVCNTHLRYAISTRPCDGNLANATHATSVRSTKSITHCAFPAFAPTA